ncbi:RISC-loading complex subunit tarbp2-like [Lethenteron reissneri]|uniref:RISC-loading complex subunit tarbp2-like n=1 Tax=Lethenteron reissneri TaxID=7753 RepID=UPI002AB7A264|nr:RISC-loading complex subunit tarbp2-like [Lethenteron reissneri]
MSEHGDEVPEREEVKNDERNENDKENDGDDDEDGEHSSEPRTADDSGASTDLGVSGGPGKTPISLLQEYGTRIGKTPVYDLLKAEGQAHQPNFTFRVSVGDVSCIGQGPSKKAAKHKAAEAALNILKCESMQGDAASCDNGHSLVHVENGSSLPSQPNSDNNPVGALQELVVLKGWRLPEYTVTHESGPAHRKEFTMTCRVESFIETGSGTSKKLAKRNAAAQMLTRIRDLVPERREAAEAECDDGDHAPLACGSRGKVTQGCTWDSLRNSAGEKIGYLKKVPLDALGDGYCKLLQELAHEQRFHITYFDLDMSRSGRCQCLVELSTQPVAVCHGSGNLLGEAHAKAAYSALQYLKLMAGRKQ